MGTLAAADPAPALLAEVRQLIDGARRRAANASTLNSHFFIGR